MLVQHQWLTSPWVKQQVQLCHKLCGISLVNAEQETCCNMGNIGTDWVGTYEIMHLFSFLLSDISFPYFVQLKLSGELQREKGIWEERLFFTIVNMVVPKFPGIFTSYPFETIQSTKSLCTRELFRCYQDMKLPSGISVTCLAMFYITLLFLVRR